MHLWVVDWSPPRTCSRFALAILRNQMCPGCHQKNHFENNASTMKRVRSDSLYRRTDSRCWFASSVLSYCQISSQHDRIMAWMLLLLHFEYRQICQEHIWQICLMVTLVIMERTSCVLRLPEIALNIWDFVVPTANSKYYQKMRLDCKDVAQTFTEYFLSNAELPFDEKHHPNHSRKFLILFWLRFETRTTVLHLEKKYQMC